MKHLVLITAILGFANILFAQNSQGAQVWKCSAQQNHNLTLNGTKAMLIDAANSTHESSLIFKIVPTKKQKLEVEALLTLLDESGNNVRIFNNLNRPANIYTNKTLSLSEIQDTVELSGSVPRSEYSMSASLNVGTGVASASISSGLFKKSTLTATFANCEIISY